jgi:hypothetical protein
VSCPKKYTGYGSEAYFGVEGTHKAGDPSTDQNIAFNKMAMFPPPKGQYAHESMRDFSKRTPSVSWTTVFEPGERFIGPFVMKDPFLMLTMFTHKTVGGVWGTGTGTIAADFTDVDDEDSIFIQYRNFQYGGSAHLDRLLLGGKVTGYKWIIEKGKMLMEDVQVKTLAFSVNTQLMNLNANFQDQSFSATGGFADWDDTGILGSRGRSCREVVIEWNGVAIPGINITSGEMLIESINNSEQSFDELEHCQNWDGNLDFTLTLEGNLKALDLVLENEKIVENKTSATMKIYYDDTGSYEKFVQATNVVVETHNVVEIAPTGEVSTASVTFKMIDGGAISYSGSFLDLPDPSALITTSP